MKRNMILITAALLALFAVFASIMMFNFISVSVSILNFGIRQIALLLGLGVLVAFIGSFFPVMSIARKRPIDAIKNK